MTITSTLPWLLPGVVVALVVSIAASAAVGRWLGVRRSVAWVLLFSIGVILAGTLSPIDLLGTHNFVIAGQCDFARLWPASPSDLQLGQDVAGNIALFIPVGLAIGIVPMSMRKVGLLAGAIALPFALEAAQLALTPLGRNCQSADVIDNLTGLAIGLAAGLLVAWLVPAVRRPAARA